MIRTCIVSLTACVLAALVLPGVAVAGVPFQLGTFENGSNPQPSVTPGVGGTMFVVWNDPRADRYVVCRVPKGTKGCSPATILASPVNEPDRAWIARDPVSGAVHVIAPQYVAGDTYAWTSTNDGASFGPPVKLWGGVNGQQGTDSERPLLRGDRVAVPTWNPPLRVHDVPLSGAASASESRASLNSAGTIPGSTYRLDLAATGAGTLATADDLDNVFSWLAPEGGDLNASPTSGTPRVVAKGTDSAMHGSPAGSYVAYTDKSFQIRKWGGMAFGAPMTLDPGPGYLADVFVSPNGIPGAVYRRNGTGLRYASSKTNGQSFRTRTIVRSDVTFFDLNVAHDEADTGLAAWKDKNRIMAADLTEVFDSTAAKQTKSVTVKGFTLTASATSSCTRAGSGPTTTATGKGKGSLEKVAFVLAGKGITDKTPAFVAAPKIPKTAKPGATAPVRVIGTVVQKGKSFKLQVKLPVRVCGG